VQVGVRMQCPEVRRRLAGDSYFCASTYSCQKLIKTFTLVAQCSAR
jgi:hypothetical protein